MNDVTLLLFALGTTVVAVVLLIVYAIRCVVRVVVLFAAAWAVQADAYRVDVIALAQGMTDFVFRGRRKGGVR